MTILYDIDPACEKIFCERVESIHKSKVQMLLQFISYEG